jgi:hypothetical protein
MNSLRLKVQRVRINLNDSAVGRKLSCPNSAHADIWIEGVRDDRGRALTSGICDEQTRFF